MDLFSPIVPAEKQHPHFRVLVSPGLAPERKLLSQWAANFPDRDGKFSREFQTSFWPSFWELYLNAAFVELGFAPNYAFATPDFPLGCLNAEATVALHADGYVSERFRAGELPENVDIEAALEYATLRLSNALSGKISKYKATYAALSHVRDRPFVVCIAPFEQPLSFVQNDQAMRRVLYAYDTPIWREGLRPGERLLFGHTEVAQVEKDSGASVPLGYFRSTSAEEVSAVIFSSTAAFAKLRVLAPTTHGEIIVSALRYQAHADVPRLSVQRKQDYAETLLDGIHLFLNPHARHKLDTRPFEGREIAIHHGYDAATGLLHSDVPDGFLIQRTSMAFQAGTLTGLPAPERGALKTPQVREWPDGELRSVGGTAMMFKDNHLAHYKGWTLLVALDAVDNDWLAMALKGTHRTLSAFIAANKSNSDLSAWLVVDSGSDSKELARDRAVAEIQKRLCGYSGGSVSPSGAPEPRG